MKQIKRVVDGKRYNTATAEEVCDISPRIHDRSNFRYEDTRLYRTKNGRWFIAGEGHAMSRWAASSGGGMRCWGSGLTVITDEDARMHLEEHDALEALEKYFVVEDA